MGFEIVKNKFREIHVPAGRDSLVFRPAAVAVDETWEAERYLVWRWKGGWSYERPHHHLLGHFQGHRNTRELAMRECGQDYEKVCRVQRWIEHMSHYEPGENR